MLADRKACTGCTACVCVCKNNAITMIEGEGGFLYPTINSKCVNCGLCTSVCPVLNARNSSEDLKITYAAYSKDNTILKTSSSGGVFSHIALKVLGENGVVYGCAQSDDFSAIHIRVDNKSDLERLKGSKYIQSDLGKIFNQVEADLISGKIVLFSGTPCQVLGLKAFLKTEYAQLITADLVCHGVASKKYFNDYIKWFENKYKCKIRKYIFRDTKKKNVCLSRITVESRCGKLKNYETYFHPKFWFYYLYMYGYFYRESCYNCPCLSNNRVSDITLGDCWGIKKILPKWGKNKGVSVVVVHTKRGLSVIGELGLVKEKIEYKDAVKYNKSIEIPVDMPKEYHSLFNGCSGCGIDNYDFVKQKIGKITCVINTLKSYIPVNIKNWMINLKR